MLKAKKRKTSSTSRKSVSRKPVAVQKKVVKKDKSKLAWQIVLGIAAALLLLFIIAKFSASVTGNVPAVDAAENIANKEGPLTQLMKPILPYVGWLIGESNEDQLLLSRILFFMIWFLFFWFLSGKIAEVNKRGWFHLIASFVLGILFTRWIVVDDILKTVLMPYSAVGAALAAFLPILVAFYFLNFVLQGENVESLRVFGWILIAGYLLWGYYNGLKDPLVLDKEWLWAYPIAIVVTILLLIFSKKIRAELIISQVGRTSENYKDNQRQEILRQISLVEQNLADRMISANEADRIIGNLKNRLREIERRR